jgi:hypothetical protein
MLRFLFILAIIKLNIEKISGKFYFNSKVKNVYLKKVS